MKTSDLLKNRPVYRHVYRNLLVLSAIALATIAADRPPIKVWETTLPYPIDNQSSVQDGRGGIAVIASTDTNRAVFWIDKKGNAIQIPTPPYLVLISCTPTKLIAEVPTTTNGFPYKLRSYKRDGTFTEDTNSICCAMYPTVQPNDPAGFFVIAADGVTLVRYRY